MSAKRRSSLIAAILCICIVFSNTTTTYAWNNTKSKKAYSSYYGYSMGTLESRIWISALSSNWSRTQVIFDATSSSWVFNANKKITKHVNAITLKKTGFTGTLSVSAAKAGSSAGLTISEQTESLCTVQTPAANSYYRGINSYNNTVTKGIVGSVLSWSTLSVLSKIVITGTSSQTVYLDGQLFTNSAAVTAYF